MQANLAKDKAYQIEATVPIAFVLVNFTTKSARVATSSLLKVSGLPEALLKTTLAQLTSTETPILKQAQSSTRKMATDATYEVNDDFVPSSLVVCFVKKPEILVTQHQQKMINKEVSFDRRNHIDSLLVKIMKRRMCAP